MRCQNAEEEHPVPEGDQESIQEAGQDQGDPDSSGDDTGDDVVAAQCLHAKLG